MHHHAALAGRLEPVGAEERELLALRLAGADGERPRAQAEGLALGDRLEVARAGIDREGLQDVGLVQRRQRAEAGELEPRAPARAAGRCRS